MFLEVSKCFECLLKIQKLGCTPNPLHQMMAGSRNLHFTSSPIRVDKYIFTKSMSFLKIQVKGVRRMSVESEEGT